MARRVSQGRGKESVRRRPGVSQTSTIGAFACERVFMIYCDRGGGALLAYSVYGSRSLNRCRLQIGRRRPSLAAGLRSTSSKQAALVVIVIVVTKQPSSSALLGRRLRCRRLWLWL